MLFYPGIVPMELSTLIAHKIMLTRRNCNFNIGNGSPGSLVCISNVYILWNIENASRSAGQHFKT